MPVGDHLEDVREGPRMPGLGQEPVQVRIEHAPGVELEHPVAVLQRIRVPVEGQTEGLRRKIAARRDEARTPASAAMAAA